MLPQKSVGNTNDSKLSKTGRGLADTKSFQSTSALDKCEMEVNYSSSIESEIELTEVTVRQEPNPLYICRSCGENCESEADRLDHHKKCIQNQSTNPPSLNNDMERQPAYNSIFLQFLSENKNDVWCRCGAKFQSEMDLKNHIETCPKFNPSYKNKDKIERKKHQCSICGRIFNHLSLLNIHLRAGHEEKSFDCDKCNKRYTLKRTLEDHYALHHIGKPRYQCEICGKTFFQLPCYRRHNKIIHPIEYAQTLATKGVQVFPINELYSMDGCVVYNDKNETTSDIQQDQKSSETLNESNLMKTEDSDHEGLNTSIAMDKCKMEVDCSMIKSEIELTEATVCQEPEYLYSCESCGEKFESEAVRVDHYNRCIHDQSVSTLTTNKARPYIVEDGAEYVCQVCNNPMVYKQLYSFVLHQINAHGIFDNSFCRRVKKNEVPPFSEFPYHCNVCDYWFRHKRLHLHHECSMAKVQNIDAMNLTNRCSLCKKTFKYRSTLYKHLENEHQQSRNRKHKCDLCERCFITSKSVEEHKFSVHYKQPLYRCTLCEKTTYTDGAAYAHRRKYHKEELERLEIPFPALVFIERLKKT
ncbi:zinc finger protein 12-like [Uranotaenia lowii]|uniref:zinc finger protein 12-like n=1 Tax=Uranotaenia lowii TaxID=190385 RepID=UPI002479CB8B|nr:zinc finger protein 12-like [Uranotaenia lowii]XP_055586068.1 zinc finger protein 12-like [Uranotaenia lowii]XP_055586076.1 zinc finger protein 12-like [Uranotaenia lowii]